MNIEVGKKYYRKRGACGTLREVLAIRDGRVDYRVLHGPARKRTPLNTCSLKNFALWADGEFEGQEYHRLDGAGLPPPCAHKTAPGEPISRCSARRGKFYLKKGYAVRVDE